MTSLAAPPPPARRARAPRSRRRCTLPLAPAQLYGLWAATLQLTSQKLPCRIQAVVIVIVNAGFAERDRDREEVKGEPASPDQVKGEPASPDQVIVIVIERGQRL